MQMKRVFFKFLKKKIKKSDSFLHFSSFLFQKLVDTVKKQ